MGVLNTGGPVDLSPLHDVKNILFLSPVSALRRPASTLFSFTCPHCGYEVTFSAGDVDFEADSRCPACGKELFPETLEDEESSKEESSKEEPFIENPEDE